MENKDLQFGINATNKKIVITSPGEGSVSLSLEDLEKLNDFASESLESTETEQ